MLFTSRGRTERSVGQRLQCCAVIALMCAAGPCLQASAKCEINFCTETNIINMFGVDAFDYPCGGPIYQARLIAWPHGCRDLIASADTILNMACTCEAVLGNVRVVQVSFAVPSSAATERNSAPTRTCCFRALSLIATAFASIP